MVVAACYKACATVLGGLCSCVAWSSRLAIKCVLLCWVVCALVLDGLCYCVKKPVCVWRYVYHSLQGRLCWLVIGVKACLGGLKGLLHSRHVLLHGVQLLRCIGFCFVISWVGYKIKAPIPLFKNFHERQARWTRLFWFYYRLPFVIRF